MGRWGFIIFFLAAGVAAFAAAPAPARMAGNDAGAVPASGVHDFDFLPGQWTVRNRRLAHRFANSHEWVQFDAQDDITALPGGLGNQELYRTDYWKGFQAVGLNFYEADNHRWALYWVDNRNSPGALQPPVHGGFKDDTGTFEGEDTLAGKPIRVRHIWKPVDHDHVHWEQAFSADGGTTWETNWTMDFIRQPANRVGTV